MRLMWLASLMTMALLGQEGGPGRGPGGMRRPMSPLMMALDADQDGNLSAKEIQQAAASLKKADRNGDGKIEGEEMRPPFGGRGPGGPGGPEGRREGGPGSGGPNVVDTLMGFDADKDGKLTKAEVPERMQGLFARADANKDGVLTREELAKLQAPGLAERAGGPSGPGGRGPMMMDPIAGALDANHDGVIDAAELKKAPAALAALDRNKDGQLDATEVRPPFMGGGRGREGKGPEGDRH